MPPPSSPVIRNGSTLVSSRADGAVTPCSPGLGLKETVEEYLRPAEAKEAKDFEAMDGDADDELDISGIDDEEIESYLMTPG